MVTSARIHWREAVVVGVLFATMARPSDAQTQFDGKPIPNGPDVKINRAFREGFYRYCLQLADAYRQHTKDDPEVQPIGTELFKMVARIRALEQSIDEAQVSELRQLSQRL